jgi:hypothetical protein
LQPCLLDCCQRQYLRVYFINLEPLRFLYKWEILKRTIKSFQNILLSSEPGSATTCSLGSVCMLKYAACVVCNIILNSHLAGSFFIFFTRFSISSRPFRRSSSNLNRYSSLHRNRLLKYAPGFVFSLLTYFLPPYLPYRQHQIHNFQDNHYFSYKSTIQLCVVFLLVSIDVRPATHF